MKFKSILFLLILVVFTNCSKDEAPAPKPDAEDEPIAKDSITENQDTEVPKDSISDMPLDSIPEFPIDSIPEMPFDSIPMVYFTFQGIGNSQATANTDDAIMIHSAEGNLLDFKTFEGGDILIFESIAQIKPDNFTVSMLHRATYSGPFEKYTITSFPMKIKVLGQTINSPRKFQTDHRVN